MEVKATGFAPVLLGVLEQLGARMFSAALLQSYVRLTNVRTAATALPIQFVEVAGIHFLGPHIQEMH